MLRSEAGIEQTMESVILVDENDAEIGVCEKLEAHRSGRLHRAFSVIVFNASGDMLLQRRALTKYHSGGLWSNACCGHPRPGETVLAAANRRLHEEMGICCELALGDSVLYRARLNDELTEYEYDHVLFGVYDGEPVANASEVMSWRWADMGEELVNIARRPDIYSAWLALVLPLADPRSSGPRGCSAAGPDQTPLSGRTYRQRKIGA
ncbi:MAG: isopentenyl-diphosphate Delta-isomerase [Gemmatimonadota bacterium]|nr:isopentenyl-diphosphate Delta-isomerase [Gemmatimonadota bacterium]